MIDGRVGIGVCPSGSTGGCPADQERMVTDNVERDTTATSSDTLEPMTKVSCNHEMRSLHVDMFECVQSTFKNVDVIDHEHKHRVPHYAGTTRLEDNTLTIV
jgi:hypothetical protein